MRHIKISLIGIFLLSALSINAQEKSAQVTSEVQEKTLKIKRDGTVTQNSVKITTEIRQAVMTDPDDNGKVNGDRIFPPKVVVKTVEIDNDNDELYDERIKFSYLTENRTDFALVTDKDEIMIAVEKGDNISVIENQKMLLPQEGDKTSYIYTDEDGAKIEFRIEESWSEGTK